MGLGQEGFWLRCGEKKKKEKKKEEKELVDVITPTGACRGRWVRFE